MATVERMRIRAESSKCKATRHGTHTACIKYGCRCPAALADHAEYNRRRREAPAAHQMVRVTGSRRMLKALVRWGHPPSKLAAELGIDEQLVHRLMGRKCVEVEASLASRVRDVYDQLSMVRGSMQAPCDCPPGDPCEHPVVDETCALAVRENWPPPLAWDDDEIDEPYGRPQGVSPPGAQAGHARSTRAVDWLAIYLVVWGERRLPPLDPFPPLTPPEQRIAIELLWHQPLSLKVSAERLGTTEERLRARVSHSASRHGWPARDTRGGFLFRPHEFESDGSRVAKRQPNGERTPVGCTRCPLPYRHGVHHRGVEATVLPARMAGWSLRKLMVGYAAL